MRTARKGVLLLALLAAGCHGPAPKRHSSLGRPKRIVSLAPSVTEMLYAVGAGDHVVGADDFSNYPPEAKRLARIGGLSVNNEAVLALRPDVVVGVADLQGASLARLARLGQRTMAVDTAGYQKTIDAIRGLGSLGDPARADAAAKRLEAARAAARAAAPRRAPAVLCVAEASPNLFVAGQGTFQDDLLRLAGARNAAPIHGFAPLSRETLARIQPDLALVADEADAAAMRRRFAGRKLRIAVMPRDILVRPGPRLGEGLAWLSHAIQGTAKP
ncbi:MAG TPA: helical backbone metal receptor [Armatimonadota bacterium]|jgi:iron complex transport system substrate-binding protein